MTEADRRRASRDLQRYLVRFDDAGEMRLAFSNDVSPDGLFLRTRFPPPPGTDLRLMVRTAHGVREHAGVVVWTRMNFCQPDDPAQGSGAGIRFAAHRPADR
ncbi:MAG: PilZ domain-containing protein, partial [Acidobacteriota bacterium]